MLFTEKAFRENIQSVFRENILHQRLKRRLRFAFDALRRHAHNEASHEKRARSLCMLVNARRLKLLSQSFTLWRVEALSHKLNQVCRVSDCLMIMLARALDRDRCCVVQCTLQFEPYPITLHHIASTHPDNSPIIRSSMHGFAMRLPFLRSRYKPPPRAACPLQWADGGTQ